MKIYETHFNGDLKYIYIASTILFHLIEGPPADNIPQLDEVNDEDTVSTCRALHFYCRISPSAAVSTISDMNLNSASSISIGSQHIS